MRLTFPLIEVAGPGAVTIENLGVSDDGRHITYRFTAPLSRVRSLAGLFPLVTWPGHDVDETEAHLRLLDGRPVRFEQWQRRLLSVPEGRRRLT